MKQQNDFIRPKEAAEILQCSLSKSYKILSEIKKEMRQEGLLTIAGRVPRSRFLRRVGLI